MYRFLILEGFIAPITFLFYSNIIRNWLINKNYQYKAFIPIIAQLYSIASVLITYLILGEKIRFSLPYIELIFNQGLICVGLYEVIKCTKEFIQQKRILRKRVKSKINKKGL